MWENTTPSTELPRDLCARIGPLQLGVVLVLLCFKLPVTVFHLGLWYLGWDNLIPLEMEDFWHSLKNHCLQLNWLFFHYFFLVQYFKITYSWDIHGMRHCKLFFSSNYDWNGDISIKDPLVQGGRRFKKNLCPFLRDLWKGYNHGMCLIILLGFFQLKRWKWLKSITSISH